MVLADSATERDTFLAVVYADADWLRAEFDAIVAASWDQPPARPEPSGSPDPAPGRPAVAGWPERPVPPGRRLGAAPARERGPPRRRTSPP
jgi:hypothetical protein